MRDGLFVVADQALAAQAIRRELDGAVPFPIAGCLDGRRACEAVVAAANPRVVVFDDMREREDTLRRIRECRSCVPRAKLVLITRSLDPSWLSDVATAGIDAVIAKRVRRGSLGALLREVVEGNVFHAFGPLPEPSQKPAAAGLTARETEILKRVAAGASNACIARELWVTPQTVKFHLSNVFRKLGVANRTQAGHYAHVHHLLDAGLADADTVYDAAAGAA